MIHVVIPCYDAAAYVGDIVHGAKQHEVAVIVVDDGSHDDSAAVATAAGADHVIKQPYNIGKGAAIAAGFAFARERNAEAVITMDADGQHSPSELPGFLAAHRKNSDALVIGVRSFAPADMPRRSRIGNRISTWWISRFCGRTHRDTQSGYRLYPRGFYDLVRIDSQRFAAESELLLLAAKMRVPFCELPIATIYNPDHVSHFHGFTDTMRVLTLVLSSPFWRRPPKNRT